MERKQITSNEKNEILNSAKCFLNSNEKEIDYDNPESAYLKLKDIVDDDYYWAYDAPNDLLYDLILHEEVADLYFFHSRCDTVKSQAIIECAIREDFIHGEKLFSRLVQVANYEDYILPYRCDWETSVYQTIRQILEYFALDCYRTYTERVISEESRRFVIEQVEKAIDYLRESSRKMLLSALALSDATGKYKSLYVQNLLYDAKRYTTFPCPKGFSKDKNRVSIELAEAITALFKMNEIETLKEIANLLKNAHAEMKYNSWLKECRIKLPEDIYSAIEAG